MKKFLSIMLVIAFCITLCFVGYGWWRFKKALNYRFQYESMVEETVREMVKPECLKK
jgi:hypothetical protein